LRYFSSREIFIFLVSLDVIFVKSLYDDLSTDRNRDLFLDFVVDELMEKGEVNYYEGVSNESI
jgi:hypothetical protein